MADPTTRASAPAKGGGGKKGELLGQPWWVWAAGAGALVLGYLYLKSHQQQASTPQGAGGQRGGGAGGGGMPWSTQSLSLWIKDHHGHHHGGGGGGGGHHHKGHNGDVVGTYKVTSRFDQTFAEMAKRFHWSKRTIAWIEHHDKVTGSTQIHKGQQLTRPKWRKGS